MYAVVKTGGKQYRVAKDDVIKVEKLDGAAGDVIALDEVLMLADGDKVTIGAPRIDGASVAAEILEQARAKKVIIFKKRRRQNYRRKKGHRQHLTVLRVTDILTGGAKPKAAKKSAPKKAAAKAETPKKETAKKATPKAAAKAAPKADFIDDVSLISGVGPVLKKKLAEFGVSSLKDIAAMKKADVEKMDEALNLRGRAERDEWVEQAKELIAGKPPRAKVDQDAAAKKK
jgi:large subunit ribosomal protein L21